MTTPGMEPGFGLTGTRYLGGLTSGSAGQIGRRVKHGAELIAAVNPGKVGARAEFQHLHGTAETVQPQFE